MCEICRVTELPETGFHLRSLHVTGAEQRFQRRTKAHLFNSDFFRWGDGFLSRCRVLSTLINILLSLIQEQPTVPTCTLPGARISPSWLWHGITSSYSCRGGWSSDWQLNGPGDGTQFFCCLLKEKLKRHFTQVWDGVMSEWRINDTLTTDCRCFYSAFSIWVNVTKVNIVRSAIAHCCRKQVQPQTNWLN